MQKQLSESSAKETEPLTEEDTIVDIMGRHDQFVSSMQSRLAKLQVSLYSHCLFHKIQVIYMLLEKFIYHPILFLLLSTDDS